MIKKLKFLSQILSRSGHKQEAQTIISFAKDISRGPETSYLNNHLVKLSKALESFGSKKEYSIIRSLAGDSDEKTYEVYHGSPNDFVVFDPEKSKEFGFHFGTLESAGHRGSRDDKEFYLKKFKVKIKNPLIFKDWDPGRWSPALILEGIERGHSNISDNKKKDLHDRIKNFENESRRNAKKMFTSLSYEKNELFKSILEEVGYDGIIYENKGESGGQAYIIFRPSNIELMPMKKY